MKISIISGSNRKNSQSIKISKIYFEKLNRLDASVNLISLEKERLPFWEDDFEGYIPPYKEAFKNISIKLHESEGFNINTNITASGNVSASGDLIVNNINGNIDGGTF